MQLSHEQNNFKKQQFPIILLCDNVTNAPNIGSLFRIADAFGVEELIFCGEHIPIGRRMTKTSRSTENYMKYRVESDALSVVEEFKNLNYIIVSLEISEQSLPLHQFNFKLDKPIILIVGHENFGISELMLKASNAVLHINMYGHNSSMNVVQATGIALYEITNQLSRK
ncbi:TrmH family RNA methyltransferase [Paucihalobacter sp.]|uniref:TrmH family RNA methyltransferase n=1 Tax=Paucihalobacter sp. TaxID=2850405 RepID=UPI002FE2C291